MDNSFNYVRDFVRAEAGIVLDAGKVVASGSVEAVMGRADLQAAGGLFEGGTVIEARVQAVDKADGVATLAFDGGTLTVGQLDAPVGEAVRVRIRAREVSLALTRPAQISIQNILRGTIREIDAAHGDVNVSIALGDTGASVLRARVTRRACAQLALQVGQSLWAQVKSVALVR